MCKLFVDPVGLSSLACINFNHTEILEQLSSCSAAAELSRCTSATLLEPREVVCRGFKHQQRFLPILFWVSHQAKTSMRFHRSPNTCSTDFAGCSYVQLVSSNLGQGRRTRRKGLQQRQAKIGLWPSRVFRFVQICLAGSFEACFEYPRDDYQSIEISYLLAELTRQFLAWKPPTSNPGS